MNKLIVILLVLTASGFAQKRVLVSPNGDAIPITKNMSARTIIAGEMARRAEAMVCTDKATFGYSAAQNPDFDVNHIGFHQDIMAMWYVAPASGTIDTVYWFSSDVGSLDSTVTVRLFESNIYPGSGPGYDGYPKPGRLCWGYYLNTNDLDNGIAAFPEDATDPTWYSTVSGGIPSFTPMGNEIWGFGGFPVITEAFAVNQIDLSLLGSKPDVTVGDPFFITVKIYGPHVDQETEDQTGFYAITENDTLSTHNWKFYEHIVEIQPGFTCPGWVARADFNILFWYSMTVTTNIPPTFDNVTDVNNTFSNAPQTVTADIIDCDPSNPAQAGVETALIRYSVNGEPQADLAMTNIGGDTWEVPIPGGTTGDVYSYRVVATDSSGFTDSSSANQYRIVSLSTAWYSADTSAVCADQDIRSTGTTVANSSFFVPGYSGSGTSPMDDGTSGPYDMGSDFSLFGDEFRYAWIGVNGAIALSKAADDTLDVNSNGYATAFWDFPDDQKSGREDTSRAGNMPGMFIAPFWADHILEDTAGIYGRAVYGNNGDPCLFIVEWDSIGAFDDAGAIPDETTFRVVLNRCDGTVEFQYVSVGTTGLDSAALVGMQADSNDVSGPEPGWIFVNQNTYPFESKPRNDWCVKLYPNISTVALDGWNMVAVSLTPEDAVYTSSSLFPTAVSSAYEYASGYSIADPLSKGRGYWLKFDVPGGAGSSRGTFDSALTAPVQDKWNMIGGPSGFVPTGDIAATGTSVTSAYFGYGAGGYYTATTIQPGRGYWVKVNGAGTLEMVSSDAAPKQRFESAEGPVPSGSGRITISDAGGRSQTLYLCAEEELGEALSFYEMPPLPPSGAYDVRFSSQRMLETYSAVPEDDMTIEYPVTIQGATYPLTVRWEINAPVSGGRQLVLGDAAGTGTVRQVMEATGAVTITDAAISTLVVRITGGSGVPASFRLSQNFPNPFNPSTRFTVDVPARSNVEIGVFDLLGRKIATLANGPMEAGSHGIEWNGTDAAGMSVPTGMYLVRMRAEGFSDTKKVLFMK